MSAIQFSAPTWANTLFARLRLFANLYLQAFLHPFSTTYFDRKTGKVIYHRRES